jgi:hypothetical protein
MPRNAIRFTFSGFRFTIDSAKMAGQQVIALGRSRFRLLKGKQA